MGHDTHFLSRLDRVSAEQADLALRLYRDEGLLRTLLNTERLPPDADRVAISLGERDVGPFVLITREGKFVTCLGRGMHLGNRHVITRNRLEEIGGYLERLNHHIAAARELRPDGRLGTLIRRIYDAGDALAREEMIGILAFKPFLSVSKFRMVCQDAKVASDRLVAMHRLRRPRAADVKALQSAWHLVWAVGHNAVLCCGEEVAGVDPLAPLQPLPGDEPEDIDPRFAVLRATSLFSASFTVFRGAWSVGSVGRPALEECIEGYQKAEWAMFYTRAVLALLALAWRHPETADDVRRALAQPPRIVLQPDAHPSWREIWEQHKQYIPTILDRKRGPEDSEQMVRKVAYTALQQCPEGSVYRRYTRLEEVPLEIAIPIVMRHVINVLGFSSLFWMAAIMQPTIARASAKDLYPPKDLLKSALGSGWTVDKGMELLECFRQNMARPEPTRVQKKPRPNEPCSCGSGKKFKRCCGAAG